MERNITTLQMVNSPLNNQDAIEFEDFPLIDSFDPFRTAGRRMILILVIVALVAFSLGVLALPATSQSKNFGQSNTSEDVFIDPAAVSEAQNNGSLSTLTERNGRIADFFTPEVHYWESKIVEWAAEHNVDPNAVATIMQIESCGDPQAVSVAGARGLFQVMPFHFSSDEDMLDPDTNAMRGMNFFNEQLRYTGGDVLLSFAGYNGGYAASGGDYANWPNETQRYYEWARGIYQDAANSMEQSETLDAWLAAGGAAGCQRAADRLGLN